MELRLACGRHLRQEIYPYAKTICDSPSARALIEQITRTHVGYMHYEKDEELAQYIIKKLSTIEYVEEST